MKSIGIIGLAALLLTIGAVQAGDGKTKSVINQDLSKRPYQELPADSSANKADDFDGATLITEDNSEVKTGPTKHQQLRIRMLGQRPYMEKSGE